MSKTIDAFTSANGLLTPAASLVSGYDFLSDGATTVNAPFATAFGANAKTLINNTWTNTPAARPGCSRRRARRRTC